jgi:hypothetical protein
MPYLVCISKMRYKHSFGGWKFSTKRSLRRIAALPADMQARFLRLAERIASVGLESLSEPSSTWKGSCGSCG